MAGFTAVTWAMVALLALALIFGQPFAALALAYITVFTFFMDRIASLTGADQVGEEFPSGEALSLSLGIVHFPLLYGGVWAISSASTLTTFEKVLIFFALSLFLGQVSNSNAHELNHRAPPAMRRLGLAVYSSILFGHHVSIRTGAKCLITTENGGIRRP